MDMNADGSAQPNPTLPRKAVAGWLAALVLIGLCIRVSGTYSYAFSGDDMLHLHVATAPTLAEVLRWAHYEAHPPLFYILLHYWAQISDAPGFLRSLPLLLGMTLIPIYYCIGRTLGGQLGGLACATLVTISHGCIMQSFVLRHYCVLLPALSLAHLCYLRWRKGAGNSALAGYALFGMLAAASHFSAMLYFVVLAGGESTLLVFQKQYKRVVFWLAANVPPMALSVLLYLQWQPTLLFLKAHNAAFLFDPPTPGLDTLIKGLGAPFAESFYICLALPLLPLLILYAFAPRFASPARTALAPCLWFAVVACVASAALYASGLYPIRGTRHNLWMLPLLLPPIGAMAADLLQRLHASFGQYPWRSIAVMMLFMLVCDMGKKLQGDEYGDWQNGPWQEIAANLAKLGPGDVIVTDKVGGNLLMNLYPYRTDAAFMNGGGPMLLPYGRAHLLMSPEVMGVYNHRVLRKMMMRANDSGLFNSTARFVFLKLWLQYPMYDLLTCAALPREALYPAIADHAHLATSSFALVAISKQDFLRDVLPETGKAHGCLDERHDQEGGFYLPMTAKHPE